MSDPITMSFSGPRHGVLAWMEICREAAQRAGVLVRIIDHDSFELVVDAPRAVIDAPRS